MALPSFRKSLCACQPSSALHDSPRRFFAACLDLYLLAEAPAPPQGRKLGILLAHTESDLNWAWSCSKGCLLYSATLGEAQRMNI
eukprot:scaffold7099_cov281-Pinguiococcus_pyrenoidosus.AAC.33